MKHSTKFVFLLASGLLAFNTIDKKSFEFNYPRKKGTNITLVTGQFKKFTKEWRGSDYYYYAEADGFICSVLYYKLNDEEKLSLVDAPRSAMNGPEISPAYPLAYFSNYSNLKSMEANDSSWGDANSDFMFRQNDVTLTGTNFSQKHMYGYCMVDKDLFVNIHLSKTACTNNDSTEMIDILKSLIKSK
ncbi:MAG TPA: hypothetical protein PLA68_01735 [Panacibacter sp.]|nr:hypothetical protein [Panacibacter sp.]